MVEKKFVIIPVIILVLISILSVVSATDSNGSEENLQAVSEPLSGSYSDLSADPPANTTRIVFIHHSCGSNWLSNGNGNLGLNLNYNNYYVSDTNYGWDAEPNDNLGDHTDTGDWDLWFNDVKMPYVYNTTSHSAYNNLANITNPGGENEIIMFKSCYPLSEVGGSIDDEKAIYNDLKAYFAAHPDKMFVLITPPGETTVSSYLLTRELCQWLVNKETGWLSDYPGNNVFVFDFYCVLSETNSHHRLVNGSVEYVYASNYDGVSPYHNGDDHPNSTGNQKATAEFLPLLNMAYNQWKATSQIIDVYSGDSIQAAINAASPNDTILIHGNSGSPVQYTENVVVNKTLAIMSAMDGNVTLTALNTALPVMLINNLGSNSIIQGLIFTGSDNCGIYIDSATGVTLINNTINGTVGSGKSLWGICLTSANENNILNNTVTDCEEGINLYNCQNALISGNTVKDNHWDNIALNLSILNIIVQNNISNADSGIRLIGGSNNNTVMQNDLSGNVWTSISVVSSLYNMILDGNILSNNQVGTYLYDSNNNTLSGNLVQNNLWDGIALHNSNYNNIIDHTMISGNNDGLYIIGTSNNNLIFNNNFTGNVWAGVALNSAMNNFIIQNNITGAHVGVYLNGASGNVISENNITSNDWDGIDILNGCKINVIQLNNISGSYYGERILDSSSNFSYRNNFVSNNVHAYDNATNSTTNAWDDEITGNYYDNWGSTNPRDVAGGESVDNHPSTTPF